MIMGFKETLSDADQFVKPHIDPRTKSVPGIICTLLIPVLLILYGVYAYSDVVSTPDVNKASLPSFMQEKFNLKFECTDGRGCYAFGQHFCKKVNRGQIVDLTIRTNDTIVFSIPYFENGKEVQCAIDISDNPATGITIGQIYDSKNSYPVIMRKGYYDELQLNYREYHVSLTKTVPSDTSVAVLRQKQYEGSTPQNDAIALWSHDPNAYVWLESGGRYVVSKDAYPGFYEGSSCDKYTLHVMGGPRRHLITFYKFYDITTITYPTGLVVASRTLSQVGGMYGIIFSVLKIVVMIANKLMPARKDTVVVPTESPQSSSKLKSTGSSHNVSEAVRRTAEIK